MIGIIGADSTIGSALAARLGERAISAAGNVSGTISFVGPTLEQIKAAKARVPGIGEGSLPVMDFGNATYFVGTSRREKPNAVYLDLNDPRTYGNLPACETVILCAAMTSIASCQAHEGTPENPGLSWTTNVEGISAVAQSCERKGATRIIFLSSAAVFDGTKPWASTADRTCPTTAYGRQKVAAEWRLCEKLEHMPIILRLSKVIGPNTKPFAEWRQALSIGETITAYADKRLSPVSVEAACDAIEQLMESDFRGLFHLGGKRELSYYEWACELADEMGVSRELVRPASATITGLLPEEMPQHTTLRTSTVFVK